MRIAAVSNPLFRRVSLHAADPRRSDDSPSREYRRRRQGSCSGERSENRERVAKKPQPSRRIRIRVRRPVKRDTQVADNAHKTRRPSLPLRVPDQGEFSPNTSLLLILMFAVSAVILWQILHTFR